MFLFLNIIYICALLGTNKAYTYFNGADCYIIHKCQVFGRFLKQIFFFVVSIYVFERHFDMKISMHALLKDNTALPITC